MKLTPEKYTGKAYDLTIDAVGRYQSLKTSISKGLL